MGFNYQIKKLDQKLDQALVAVSGGADSMVLLDLLVRKSQIQLVICHVNYHLRKEASKETQVVATFCQKHNLTCEFFDSHQVIKHNVQEQARNIRYAFFQKMARKHQISAVILGHHRDDHLETYFWQIQRKIVTTWFGLPFHRRYYDLDLYRPLLPITKKTILRYAQTHNVAYENDLSNFTTKYLRNRIRWTKTNKLNSFWKSFYYLLIIFKNWKNQKEIKKIDIIICENIKKNRIKANLFARPKTIIFKVLYRYLKTNNYPVKKIDKKIMQEIINFSHLLSSPTEKPKNQSQSRLLSNAQ